MNIHGDLGPYYSDIVGWNKAQESDFLTSTQVILLEVVCRKHFQKYCKSEGPFRSYCVDCSSLLVVKQSPNAGDHSGKLSASSSRFLECHSKTSFMSGW